MMKYWPIIVLGLIGILIAWMVSELVNLEILKFRAVFIVFLGLLGTLAGWKLASKA
jgi:hypothetical protein